MNSRLLLFSICFILLRCSPENHELKVSVNENSKIAGNKIAKGDFKGYLNNVPVFADDSTIWTKDDFDKVLKIKNFEADRRVFFISNKGIIYQSNTSQKIIIEFKNQSVIIPYEWPINSLSASALLDSIIFTDSKDNKLKLLLVNAGKIVPLPITANNAVLADNKIIFSEPDTKTPDALLNTLKIFDLEKKISSVFLTKQLHDEWYTSPHFSHIAGSVLENNSWNWVLFNVKNNTTTYFSLSSRYKQAYFSVQKKAFIFYNQNNVFEDTSIVLN